MRRTNADKIRQVLRDTDGLTATQVAECLGWDVNLTRVVMNQTHDIYIDRWELTRLGHGYTAIWKTAHVPADAPRPPAPKVDRKVYDAEYRKRRKTKQQAAKVDEVEAKPKTAWVTPPPWANQGVQA